MKPKTILKASMWYFIFAMIFGVFYREVTKFTNFTGKTTLSVVHAHGVVLGTILFLILFVLSVSKNFGQGSLFSKFFKTLILYIILVNWNCLIYSVNYYLKKNIFM